MSIDVKKKAKKIAKHIGEATIIELLKELVIHRILRKKPSVSETEEIPCNVVNRFKFLLNEFEELFHSTRSQNIMNIIHSSCSQLGSQITKEVQSIQKEYKWVESKCHDAKESLNYYEKYGEKEWFIKATEHLCEAIECYTKCAKPLDELLLAHGKPQTLRVSLQTIDRYYVPMREWFNHLIYEFYRLSRMSDYVHFNNEKYYMLLPEIPSRENLVTLLNALKEEKIPQSS